MRLRAAAPALIALSLLTPVLGAAPAAHAAGCGTTTDPAGDVPSKGLDIIGAKVTVTKKTVAVTLTVGQTDAKSDPAMTAGASFYVDFKAGNRGYSLWRHTSPIAPDAFGGAGVKPTHSMTATTVTWTLPRSAVPGVKRPTDACLFVAYDKVQNVEVDRSN
jgi:hypothetical protein